MGDRVAGQCRHSVRGRFRAGRTSVRVVSEHSRPHQTSGGGDKSDREDHLVGNFLQRLPITRLLKDQLFHSCAAGLVPGPFSRSGFLQFNLERLTKHLRSDGLSTYPFVGKMLAIRRKYAMPKRKKKPVVPSRFRVGDKVRVKHGVMDTEYPDMPMGGWAGTISEVHKGGMYTIRWSQETLANIHPVVQKTVREGWPGSGRVRSGRK